MSQCLITIKDEVNCSISGVDLSYRKQLSNKFKFEIPGARHMPSVRLGRWDGTKTFCSVGLKTYVNLLPEIIPMLDEWGYDIDLDDQRIQHPQFEFNQVDENTFEGKVWPKGHPYEGRPVVLREDQIEVVNQFLANTQCIQELATGFGKTLVTATLSYCCEPYGRTIVIVPNKNLIRQTYDDYINLGLDAGVFYGDRKEFGHKHTIVTWQSLNVLLKATKKDNLGTTIQEFIEDVICVMVDECHGLKADVLTAILTGCMSNIPIRWGFTGTEPEEKMNQYSLLVSIGPIINRISASELQEAGILSNCHVKIKQLVDFVEYKTYQEELRYLLDNEERLKYISGMIEEYSLDGNTLVLVDRVAAGKALAEYIDGAVFVSGATKADDRKDEYDSIATGNNQVLVATYGVAAVGINIVRLHNVVLVEPGKSFIRVIQSIGRGLRKGFEKDFVQIYDVTSTCKFAKRHLLARKKFYAKANYKYSVEKVNWQ